MSEALPTVNDLVARHRRRSIALVGELGAVVALLVAVVTLVAGLGLVGVGIAVVVGGLVALGAWRAALPAVLRFSGAVPADPHEHARLHNLVEGLCISGGLAKPDLAVVDDPALNAFAAGRGPRQATVAVTTGLLDALSRVELEGVVAELLARVRDGSVGPATVAVTTAGAAALLGDRSLGRAGDRPAPLGARLLFVAAPLQARLLHAAAASGSDVLADRAAVAMTRYPPGLLGALEKMAAKGTVVATGGRSTAHLWLAAPIPVTETEGAHGELGRTFDRHAPIDERIAALREY